MNLTLNITSEDASFFFYLMLASSVFLFMFTQKVFGFTCLVLGFVTYINLHPYMETKMMLIESSLFLMYLVVGVLVYITMGTPWALYKWHRLTFNETKRYVKTKQTLLAKLNKSSLHQLTPTELTNLGSKLNLEYDFTMPLTVVNNKNKLLTWIITWPFSVVGTVTEFIYKKYLKKLLTKIYDQLVTVYTNIGMKNSQEYLTDMETLKQKLGPDTLNSFELN